MATNCLLNQPLQLPFKRLKQTATTVMGSVAIACSVWATPASAGDPFRGNTSNHGIGNQTEAAFITMFVQGNYVEASRLLETAEADEPLAYAMKASLAYLNQDWDALETNATLTRETAERLVQRDALRGHLYTAVGHFLEGAYAITTQGTVAGTPTALSKLQQVFDELNEAEKVNATDPELNLLKGYMELMLSVNLPFSNPTNAIARLESYAAPPYLVQRGLALGYRDLGRRDQSRRTELLTQALTAVDRALTDTPNNPDLLYLKAQILVLQGDDRASLPFFRQAVGVQGRVPALRERRLAFFKQAIAAEEQLLPKLTSQLVYEWCRANDRANQTPDQTDCRVLLNGN